MTNYYLKLTPNIINPASEGSMDTSVLNGVSIQRNGYFQVYNSNNRKSGYLSDGASFDNNIYTILNDPSDNLVPLRKEYDSGYLYALSAYDSSYEGQNTSTIYPYLSDEAVSFRVGPEKVGNNNMVIAWNHDDSRLYRYTVVITSHKIEHLFEKIDLGDLSSVEILRTTTPSFDDPTSFTYAGSGLFYIVAQNNLYSITTTGVVTPINVISPTKLAWLGGKLMGLSNSHLYEINPSDGTPTSTTAISLSGDNIYSINAFSYHPTLGNILAMYNNSGMNYGTIDLVTGEITSVHACDIGNVMALACFDLEGPTLLNTGFKADNLYCLFNVNTSNYSSVVLKQYDQDNRNGDAAIAWDKKNHLLYQISTRYTNVDETLLFESIDLETQIRDVIDLTGAILDLGLERTTTTSSYISDGGNDMYDDGNVLYTDLNDTQIIEYTHTQSSSETFSEIADGIVVDGTSWFGSGSNYFTNMYNGLFVLCASNINIGYFGVAGELGADGSGKVHKESFTVSKSGTTYRVFFKKVWSAGDPSVNQLIIVPDREDLVQTFSINTDNDAHQVTGTLDSNLYYLLFAKANGLEVTTAEATIIATAFLNNILPAADINAILSNLNSNVTNITSLIEDRYNFTDYASDGITVNINRVDGIQYPQAIVYFAEEECFIVSSEFGLHKIKDGVVSEFMSNNYVFSGMAILDGILYCVSENMPFLIKIDPVNGVYLNDVVDAKFDTITFLDNTPFGGFTGLTTSGGVLYANVENAIYTIDPTTGEVKLAFATDWPFIDLTTVITHEVE